MARREKLVKQLLSFPTSMRFAEVKMIIESNGYTHHQPRSGGSHHIFRKAASDLISVPVHDNRVRRIYLKDIASKLGLAQEDGGE